MQISENSSPSSHAVGPGSPQDAHAAPVTGSPVTAEGAERRRHTRREILDQRLVSIDLGAHNGGLVLDLSTGGAAIVSVAPLERNASSPFSFQIADSKLPIEGTGTFVWVDDTGLNGGLRFEQLSPTSKKLIKQWLGEGSSTSPQDASAEAVPGQQSAAVDKSADSLRELSEKEIDPELAAKLTRLAERARLVALANGACIALRGTEGFRCQASVGTAPDVGLPLSQERSLAAECIAGRHLVVCNDATRDPRVNAATRQRLNLGSAILLPLFGEDDLVGVLGAFAERRDAFGEQSIVRLQDVARLIETNLAGTGRSGAKFSGQPTNGNGGRGNPPTNPPARRAKPDGPAISVARIFTISLIATMALLGGSYLYQLRMRSSSAQPKVSALRAPVTTQPVAPKTPSTEKQPVQSTPVTNSAAPQPVIAENRSLAKPINHRPPQVAAVVEHPAIERSHLVTTAAEPPAARRSGAKPDVPAAQKTEVSNVPAAATNSQPPHKQAVAIEATIPAPAAATTAVTPQPPQPIPHVQVLTDLLRPSPKAAGSPAVPELVSKSSIAYPQAAIAAQRQGSVILKINIAPTGAVQHIEVLDGDPVLSAEAVNAIRQWRYQPFNAGLRGTGMDLLLTVNFVLSH